MFWDIMKKYRCKSTHQINYKPIKLFPQDRKRPPFNPRTPHSKTSTLPHYHNTSAICSKTFTNFPHAPQNWFYSKAPSFFLDANSEIWLYCTYHNKYQRTYFCLETVFEQILGVSECSEPISSVHFIKLDF